MSQSTEPKLPESDIPESAVRRRMLKSFGWFALASAVPVGVYSLQFQLDGETVRKRLVRQAE